MDYVVANRVFVKPEFTEEFEQRFEKRAGQINQQPGFKHMQILQPQSNGAPYVVLTHWQSAEAFKQWVGSDDFKLAHQDPMPQEAFEDGGGIEQYQVIIEASS